ncbi:MAG: DUF302 domain-containing protein [Terracidiphilus sp.]
MQGTASTGLVEFLSSHSVDETLDWLTRFLAQKGITLFALVDHSGEAARVGLKMRPTKLAIFGNPKAGTPVMVASPSAAIDLPLKILIAEDEAGAVRVTCNTADYLAQRHGIPPDLVPALGAAKLLAEAIAQ